MNEVTFVINGQAVGKQRARTFTTSRGKVRTITPTKTRDYEKLVAFEFKRQCPHICFIGELEVIISAYYEIPKSWTKKKKEQARNGEIRPQTKPDCDNIAKAILDSLNQVAYEDDKSVVDLHLHKYYSEEPRVVVKIIGETVRI